MIDRIFVKGNANCFLIQENTWENDVGLICKKNQGDGLVHISSIFFPCPILYEMFLCLMAAWVRVFSHFSHLPTIWSLGTVKIWHLFEEHLRKKETFVTDELSNEEPFCTHETVQWSLCKQALGRWHWYESTCGSLRMASTGPMQMQLSRAQLFLRWSTRTLYDIKKWR